MALDTTRVLGEEQFQTLGFMLSNMCKRKGRQGKLQTEIRHYFLLVQNYRTSEKTTDLKSKQYRKSTFSLCPYNFWRGPTHTHIIFILIQIKYKVNRLDIFKTKDIQRTLPYSYTWDYWMTEFEEKTACQNLPS